MRAPAGGLAVLAAVGLFFAADAYAVDGPRPDPAPSASSAGGPSPDPAPSSQPAPAPSPPPPPPPPAPSPPPPPPPSYTPQPSPPAYVPAAQPAQHVTPAKPAHKAKRAAPKVKLHFAGGKLKARPKAEPKQKPLLTVHVAAQSRAAPPSAAALPSQTGPAPLRKTEASVARPLNTSGGGGGGSSLALWFMIALGGLGALLLAGAFVPDGVLASTHLHRRLAQRRVDVAMSGATMLGCLLVLLALGR